MEFRFGGLRSRFRIGNEASRSSAAERVAEWKVEIGDGVQDLFREVLFPECSFSRNVGECAERVMKVVSNKRLLLLL